ncbi:MAG: ComEC/Rec2 family competence protein [Bacteroidaceae bacterium]
MDRLGKTLLNNPLLRILPPFAVGIIAANEGSSFLLNFYLSFWWMSFGLLAALIILMPLRQKMITNYVFGITLYTLLFCFGAALQLTNIKRNDKEWSKDHLMYRGILVQQPVTHGKVTTCQMLLTDVRDSTTRTSLSETIQISFLRDSTKTSPHVGDAIAFYGKLTSPRNLGNPKEFDYAAYLLRQQIRGTAFVFANEWILLTGKDATEVNQQLSWLDQLKVKMLQHRNYLLQRLKSSLLSGQDLAVISALTLGDKSTLQKGTKETYSQTGASHILALSGLHLGILYAIFHFLLLAGSKRRTIQIFGEIIIIVLMWCFVMLTGFPISLIRAAVMYSLLSISSLQRQRSLSLNNLAFAALLLLLINPSTLYDVSFQLSFTAVFFILVLHPVFAKYTPQNRIARYLYSLLSVSLCAQLGVAPLVAFYFHSFPTYFLLTNLVVIPFTFVVLCTSFTFFLCATIPILHSLLSSAITSLAAGLNSTVSLIASFPGAKIELYPSLPSVLLCYVIFFAIMSYLSHRKSRKIILVIGCFISILGIEYTLHSAHRLRPQIIFYNNPSCPAIHFITSADRSYLWVSKPAIQEEKMRSIENTFWKETHLKRVSLNNELNNGEIKQTHDIVCFKDKIVVILKDERWKKRSSSHPLDVDYLYLCKGSTYQFTQLTPLFRPQLVLLDSSLSDYWRNYFIEECKKRHLAFYDIKKDGAFIVKLDTRK